MTNPTPTTYTPASDPEKQYQSQRQLVIIIYALYGASLFLGGIPAIIAIIINHVQRKEIQNPILASHFTWQIRTFWFGLLFMLGSAILGLITLAIGWFGIGALFFIASTIWYIYRIVRGVLNIVDNKPVPAPASAL